MKTFVTLMMVMALLVLAAGCTPYHTQGATTGGAVGGIAGALLDSHNPWRGGVIGAALGAIMGATLADISLRGSQEAVYHGKPVEYRTENGRGVYRAEPQGYNPQTRCHKVHETVYEDGRLIKDHIKEVCEGQKIERRY